MSIFVQIASYRDSELLPTLRDCVATAEFPDQLTFGICWQREEHESLAEFMADPRCKVMSVPYQESKGLGWARNQIQQLYAGETYTLQLDSHMRFVPQWDTLLRKMIKKLQKKGHPKPLLTTYPPSYNPDRDPQERVHCPMKMVLDKVNWETRLPTVVPTFLSEKEQRSLQPSKFIAGGFSFTLGQFALEVQNAPEIYFSYDEIHNAIRAYTHGYDFFHPNCVIVWHYYTRKDKPKIWNDKTELDEYTTSYFNTFLHHCIHNLPIESYGLGTERTFQEYERYCGIDFELKKINTPY